MKIICPLSASFCLLMALGCSEKQNKEEARQEKHTEDVNTNLAQVPINPTVTNSDNVVPELQQAELVKENASELPTPVKEEWQGSKEPKEITDRRAKLSATIDVQKKEYFARAAILSVELSREADKKRQDRARVKEI